MIVDDKNLKYCKVHEVRHLTNYAYILRFERENIDFKPGNYITVCTTENVVSREYSIYSGINDDFIELLVKEVKDGGLSKQLKTLKQGDFIRVNGPFGKFCLPEKIDSKYLFVATGTGISPFHSMIKSYGNFNYRLIHGVRYTQEAYERESYQDPNYYLCTSAERSNGFMGRVTAYIPSINLDKDTLCYLCGNSNMIYEVYELLINKGIATENIFTEVYF
jgi:ferredoxin--NADP+ reductase/benzoate/toluate 1,2-dioxygenase reductase subunit